MSIWWMLSCRDLNVLLSDKYMEFSSSLLAVKGRPIFFNRLSWRWAVSHLWKFRSLARASVWLAGEPFPRNTCLPYRQSWHLGCSNSKSTPLFFSQEQKTNSSPLVNFNEPSKLWCSHSLHVPVLHHGSPCPSLSDYPLLPCGTFPAWVYLQRRLMEANLYVVLHTSNTSV